MGGHGWGTVALGVFLSLPGNVAADGPPGEKEPDGIIIPCSVTGSGADRPSLLGRGPDDPTRLPGPGPFLRPDPLLPVPPTRLPPLLQPPQRPEELLDDPSRLRPPPEPIRPPRRAEFDPGYLYLPESLPSRDREPPCPCGPEGRFWLNAAFLYGTTQQDAIPNLLSVGGTGLPVAAGFSRPLGPILGEDVAEHDFRSGLLLEGGLWLDECQTLGVEGDLFAFESNQATTRAASPGFPVLARPFVNALTMQPDAEVIAAPGLSAAAAEVSAEMSLIGGQANMRKNLWCRNPAKIDWLAGYRFVRLAEALSVATDRRNLVPFAGLPAGAREEVLDTFQTDNRFHGGQIGLAGEYRWNRLYVDVVGTVAFGVNFRDVEIAGGRRTTLPGQLPLTTPGGLLAQPTNSGTFGGDDFAVAPEVGVTFGCQLAEHWRAFFGYNLLYLSRVARPGEAIDLTVNPTQLGGGALAGPARPARTDPVTDFWVQGVTLGVEMRY